MIALKSTIVTIVIQVRQGILDASVPPSPLKHTLYLALYLAQYLALTCIKNFDAYTKGPFVLCSFF